ncbi:MAG: hypothetical protein LWX56_07545 [Ignavibacteria bacterium]|nr:hypothetical protein [Ignavibacteria bacterium]
MKTKIFFLLLVLSISLRCQELQSVNENGKKLRDYYESLQVTKYWLAGHHVDWESGVRDDPGAEHGISTHCSAFAAAACSRMGIYILRPPKHKQLLLANAQFEWLQTPEAQKEGWLRINEESWIETFVTAQNMANTGYAVVAVCQNPDPKSPGHIALIMPSDETFENISEMGPAVIQAGRQNSDSFHLRQGFSNHIIEWPEPGIWFYYNIQRYE